MLWGTFSRAALGPVVVVKQTMKAANYLVEHTDEFHLVFWPPNLPDLNPMEHIWDAMERQLRAQTPPCPNILTLCDRCLDIWYNLSLVMYQKLVASMPRQVTAVLKAKGGATCYCVGGHNVLALQCILGGSCLCLPYPMTITASRQLGLMSLPIHITLF
ncbi:hypothetical protein AVEN_169669-1 [Araneus ventricosus]|uniref:Tc1-like transposase DDE domain-containing protein n=1 Tax=Araneus ventricosus TaxID=182803 RepID=A0A4Y2D100_ARAVE|nr:hypothetical protein AVEN_169669-1 [Araneus ventricosus]